MSPALESSSFPYTRTSFRPILAAAAPAYGATREEQADELRQALPKRRRRGGRPARSSGARGSADAARTPPGTRDRTRPSTSEPAPQGNEVPSSVPGGRREGGCWKEREGGDGPDGGQDGLPTPPCSGPSAESRPAGKLKQLRGRIAAIEQRLFGDIQPRLIAGRAASPSSATQPVLSPPARPRAPRDIQPHPGTGIESIAWNAADVARHAEGTERPPAGPPRREGQKRGHNVAGGRTEAHQSRNPSRVAIPAVGSLGRPLATRDLLPRPAVGIESGVGGPVGAVQPAGATESPAAGPPRRERQKRKHDGPSEKTEARQGRGVRSVADRVAGAAGKRSISPRAAQDILPRPAVRTEVAMGTATEAMRSTGASERQPTGRAIKCQPG